MDRRSFPSALSHRNNDQVQNSYLKTNEKMHGERCGKTRLLISEAVLLRHLAGHLSPVVSCKSTHVVAIDPRFHKKIPKT